MQSSGLGLYPLISGDVWLLGTVCIGEGVCKVCVCVCKVCVYMCACTYTGDKGSKGYCKKYPHKCPMCPPVDEQGPQGLRVTWDPLALWVMKANHE